MKTPRPESNQPLPPHAKCVFKGTIFDVYQWEQELYNGQTVTFEKLKRPDTVVILPVLDNGKILITEQEQPGKKPFIGAIAGRADEGEDALDTAKRELREESGYEADQFILWKANQVTSKIDWAVFVFIAKDLRKVGDQDLDGGEKIKLKEVTLDELVDLILKNKFIDLEIAINVLGSKLDKNKSEEIEKLFSAK